MRFFTSDTHYGHQNIIRFCDRPYKHVDHMNVDLVNRAATMLEAGDELWHLGDVALGTLDSWRRTFLINVSISIAAAIAAPIFLAKSKRNRGSFDLGGALAGTLGVVAIVYGLTHASELVSENASHAWSAPVTVLALGLGVALLAVFLLIERRVKDPLMPFRILANRTRATSFAVMMPVPAGMFAMLYFLSQIVQDVMGYSSLRTGIAFLPFSGGMVLSAAIAANLMSRVDPRWLAGFGSLVASVGIWGFSRIGYSGAASHLHVDATYVHNLLPWILIMSFGMGFVFAPLTLTAVHGVGARDSGIGSGVLNAMQQVGGSPGLAVLNTVAVMALRDTSSSIVSAAQQHAARTGVHPSAPQAKPLAVQVHNVAFTHGATVAFTVGAGHAPARHADRVRLHASQPHRTGHRRHPGPAA